MNWDTIEKRWKQFLDMLRGRGHNPPKDNRNTVTAARNEAVIKLQDHRDEVNDLDDTAEFGEQALQIRHSIAPNRQRSLAPAEPSEPNREGDDGGRQEQSPRILFIRACLKHKSRRNSVEEGSSRRFER
jgi:hypothetical protein